MKSKTYFSQTLQRELLVRFCCFWKVREQ